MTDFWRKVWQYDIYGAKGSIMSDFWRNEWHYDIFMA
jgi:hypothetical protein